MKKLNRDLPKLLGLAAGATLFAMSVSPLHAETVNCDSEGKDLQKALDNASAGSVLFVTGDCDTGTFMIRKDRIKLLGFGENGATLSGSGGDRLLGLDGDHIELRNLNLNADGFRFGIILSRGTSALVDNVDVENAASAGLFLTGGSFAHVQNSSFDANETGIRVSSGSSAFIRDSSMEGNSGNGVAANHNASVTVSTGNFIDDNFVGVSVDKLSSVLLVGSVITNNTYGVRIHPKYGFLETFSPPSTIEDNGTDVRCEARGILAVNEPQSSTTSSTLIDADCEVFGTIF